MLSKLRISMHLSCVRPFTYATRRASSRDMDERFKRKILPETNAVMERLTQKIVETQPSVSDVRTAFNTLCTTSKLATTLLNYLKAHPEAFYAAHVLVDLYRQRFGPLGRPQAQAYLHCFVDENMSSLSDDEQRIVKPLLDMCLADPEYANLFSNIFLKILCRFPNLDRAKDFARFQLGTESVSDRKNKLSESIEKFSDVQPSDFAKIYQTCSHEPSSRRNLATLSLLTACLRENQLDEALQMFDNVDSQYVLPKTLLDSFKQNLNLQEVKQRTVVFETFLEKVRVNELVVADDTFDPLSDMFMSVLNQSVERVFIPAGARQCPGCGSQLSLFTLSAAEYQALLAAVRNWAFDYHLAHAKTDHHELTRFIRTVERVQPFDLILDGLNIAMHRVRVVDMKNRAFMQSSDLHRVVEYFVKERGKRVLLCTKVHIKNFPHFNRIAEMCSGVFLTNDAADDIYMILAGLMQPGSYLVTGDHLRDHAFLLGNPELQSMFYRWLAAYQTSVRLKGKHSHRENSVTVQVAPPWRILENCLQGDAENGFHIPVFGEGFQALNSSANDWLCTKPLSRY